MTEKATVAALAADASDEDALTYLFAKSDEVEEKAPGLATSLRVVGEKYRAHLMRAATTPVPVAEVEPEAPAAPKPRAKRGGK